MRLPHCAVDLAALARRRGRVLACLLLVLLLLLVLNRHHWLRESDHPPGHCTAWLDRHYPALPPERARAALLAARPPAAAPGSSSNSLPFYDLIMVVPSGGVEGRLRRGAVRAAFAASLALVPWASARLLFIVAPGSALSEAEPDMVPAPGCAEHDAGAEPASGSSTTCKVLAALVHVASRYRTHFFVRTGDDAHFRVDQFLLRVAPAHVGAERTPAQRNLVLGNWFTPSAGNPANNLEQGYLKEAYGLGGWPRYPSGMGYIYGGGVAQGLAALHAAVGLNDGFPEDGVSGLWVAGLSTTSVTRVHTPCFYNYNRLENSASCRDDGLLVHYMTPYTWALVDARGRLPTHCGEGAGLQCPQAEGEERRACLQREQEQQGLPRQQHAGR